MLGWFGVRNANSYDRVTTLQETLLKVVAANVMTRDFRVVDANQTLRDFADSYLIRFYSPQKFILPLLMDVTEVWLPLRICA